MFVFHIKGGLIVQENSHEVQTYFLFKASLQRPSSRFPNVPIIQRDQNFIDKKREQEGAYVGEQRKGRYDSGVKFIHNAKHLLFNWEEFLGLGIYGIGNTIHIYKQPPYDGHRGQAKYTLVVPIVDIENAVTIGEETIVNEDKSLEQISKEDYEKTLELMMSLWEYTHFWDNRKVNNKSTYNVSRFGKEPGEFNRDDYEELPIEELLKMTEPYEEEDISPHNNPEREVA